MNKRSTTIDEKSLQKYDPELQGAYKTAYNMGFLQSWGRKSWSFREEWIERFYLLSNVGLLCFDKPGVGSGK